ncbi:MAG: hypothetical protein R3E64_04155 [Halioglobus sp.]
MISCPHCNSTLHLEQLTEDAAGRHLFGLIAQTNCGPALVAYLGLFKPAKQALRWSRAVDLTEEILARWANDSRLGTAMTKTVESMREKRQSPQWRPLSNHNYLASVIDTLPAHAALAVRRATGKTRDRSLTEDLSDTSWAD